MKMTMVHRLVAVVAMVMVVLAGSLGASEAARALHEEPGQHFNASETTGVTTSQRVLADYQDGSGTFITLDGVRRGPGYKCWSDYFVVEQGTKKGDWKKASGDLYCTGTQNCQFATMTGATTCETWSIEVSAGVQASIINFSVSAGYQQQKCHNAQDSSQCTWYDRQCHCVWARPNIAWQSGYKRDRCNRGDGNETEAMTYWYHEAPTDHADYGCGSKCTDV